MKASRGRDEGDETVMHYLVELQMHTHILIHGQTARVNTDLVV